MDYQERGKVNDTLVDKTFIRLTMAVVRSQGQGDD